MEKHQKCWLVGYTLPQCERTLQLKLQQQGIECLLPMRKETRRWTDRKKVLDVPVFPNYIFIRTTLPRRFEHLHLRELVKYVTFGTAPATIREDEVTLLQTIAQGGADVEVTPQRRQLPAGTPVTVNAGKFAGARGILVRDENRHSVVVALTGVCHLIRLQVGADQVTPDPVPATC